MEERSSYIEKFHRQKSPIVSCVSSEFCVKSFLAFHTNPQIEQVAIEMILWPKKSNDLSQNIYIIFWKHKFFKECKEDFHPLKLGTYKDSTMHVFTVSLSLFASRQDAEEEESPYCAGSPTSTKSLSPRRLQRKAVSTYTIIHTHTQTHTQGRGSRTVYLLK